MKPDAPDRYGILYVAGTPIGNLQDMTDRMKEVLCSVDLVAAEDTRRTRTLLTHIGASPRLISCHEHNEESGAAKIIEALERGTDVALVSDAGTPVLSDPGRRVIKAVSSRNFRIVPVPGPSAVTAALSVSGMPGDQFFFQGFLPPKKAARRKRLTELAPLQCTLVFFEAPHRLAATLSDMLSQLGDRETFMARELTKMHETLFRGTTSKLLNEIEKHGVKGEITLVVSGAPQTVSEFPKEKERELKELLTSLLSGRRISTKSAASLVAAVTGLPRNRLYTIALSAQDDSKAPQT